MSDNANSPEPAAVPRKPRYWPGFIWPYQIGLQQEIETIRRYVYSITSSFTLESRKLEAAPENLPDDLTDEEAEWFAVEHGEMQADYVDRFPAFALETTFVATYGLLEAEMMEVCRLIGRELKIKLGPGDLKDKGIDAAKAYLEKLCGISVPNGRLWQQAQHYGRLRNVYSHARGRVKEGNDKVRQYIADHPTKVSIEDGRLRVTTDFCLEVLNDVESLLRSLLRLAGRRLAEK